MSGPLSDFRTPSVPKLDKDKNMIVKVRRGEVQWTRVPVPWTETDELTGEDVTTIRLVTVPQVEHVLDHRLQMASPSKHAAGRANKISPDQARRRDLYRTRLIRLRRTQALDASALRKASDADGR